MVDIFGHKTAATAFEYEKVTAGKILYDLVAAFVFDDFFLEARGKFGFTVAKTAKTKIALRVVIKKFSKVGIFGEALPPFGSVVQVGYTPEEDSY